MKINILLISIFISLILIASENNIKDTELTNCTELNGNGCVCHSLEKDPNVDVWIEGPDSLYVGQLGLYRMYMAGGPAEAGGYNVAGRFGAMELVDTFSYRNPLALNELTQAFSLPFPTTEDTIYWEFGYLASDSSNVDTIYSCGLSLVWDSIPDLYDRWNFGPKFPLTILNSTEIESDYSSSPDNFKLEQNYPNPFNPATTLRFTIPDFGFITLKVYDLLGNEVATLVNEQKPAGSYEVEFSASGGAEGLASGIYYYSLQVGSYTATKKMLLLK
jgi:hypothetical protein